LNPLAEHGFARAAEAYALARPSYPREAVETLRRELRLGPESVVLDLAAGTGKLTELLTGFARVIAVEPIAEMRSDLGRLPFVEAREGRAEAIPLEDSAVDAVLVGQAFHWFATPTVLAELHRVLRPGGGLGLLWNRWDRRVAWVDALKSVTGPTDALRPQYEREGWRAVFENQSLFAPLRHAEFENIHRLPRERLVDRVASASAVALLPEAEREELFRSVREVLENHTDTRGRAELDAPYITKVWWTFAIPPPQRGGG
jgi:SAM-dependent methyltransferase